MVEFRDLGRRVRGKKIWEHGETLERIERDDGGSTVKGEGRYSGSENENRWRRLGRREGRGSETKMMIWPDWCEEEAIVANMGVSEEIHAEASGEVRRTLNRCEDEGGGFC